MKYTQLELENIWNESNKYKIQQKKEEWMGFMKIINLKKLNNILEIGCYDGGSTKTLSYFCNKMITIDGNIPCRFNPNDFNNIEYEYIGGNSRDINIIDNVKGKLEYVDLIFIDGDHTYDGVKADFNNYSFLYRENKTIVVFHDIIDSDFHRNSNCYVNHFWEEIKQDYKHKEIIKENDIWGGIGLLYV